MVKFYQALPKAVFDSMCRFSTSVRGGKVILFDLYETKKSYAKNIADDIWYNFHTHAPVQDKQLIRDLDRRLLIHEAKINAGDFVSSIKDP